MATLKAIRRRITSVNSTKKTTAALKLVSAAKLRRAQEALVNARPYSETLARVAGSLLAGQSQALAAAEGAQQKGLLVVVAADRGLCGGYNANVARKAEETAREMRARGIEPEFFAVGRKVLEYFKRTRQPIVGEKVNNNPRLATVELASELASTMLRRYREGEVVEAGVVFSRFASALSQKPSYERIMPIAAADDARPEHQPTEYLIEPSRAELLEVVLRSHIESAVFHALLEGEASEHGARMTAMDSATSNAADMISRYTLEMNRVRQATITRELMDIVGGAEALRG